MKALKGSLLIAMTFVFTYDAPTCLAQNDPVNVCCDNQREYDCCKFGGPKVGDILNAHSHSVKAEDERLGDVLWRVLNRAGIDFIFLAELNERITVDLKKQPLPSILSNLLRPHNYDYVLSDDEFSFLSCNAPQEASAPLLIIAHQDRVELIRDKPLGEDELEPLKISYVRVPAGKLDDYLKLSRLLVSGRGRVTSVKKSRFIIVADIIRGIKNVEEGIAKLERGEEL